MKIVALAGGVGGARLCDGLAQIVAPENLVIVVNTGDDFEYLGMQISPDLDTVCYTLAGMASPETGWGLAGDTFQMIERVKLLGGPDWFRLGDRDLATQLVRTVLLKAGQSLSQITRTFCNAWKVLQTVLPMSDQPVRTMVDTLEAGELAFQEYFVHRKCEPRVKGFRFAGIESAQPSPGVLEAIQPADAVILCPSNPWVSIDPILALPGVRSALRGKSVVAVSPIINGRTVKGPAAKMFEEMGIQPSAVAVARHYQDLLSGYVLDQSDAALAAEIGLPSSATHTLMKTRADRRQLAGDVLNLIREI